MLSRIRGSPHHKFPRRALEETALNLAEFLSADMERDLIPGLPDDVSLVIMARVPRRYHAKTMAKVCSSWWKTTRSQALFEERRRLHTTEAWLYAAVLCDQENRPRLRWFARNATNFAESSDWWPLASMPERHRPVYGFRCAAIGDLLFVLGGCEWCPSARILPSTNRVSVFNARTNRWTSATEMNTARAEFACGVIDGNLLVAGGNRFIDINPKNVSWMDKNANVEAEISGNCLRSAEAYNPSTNTWTPLPDMVEAKHFVSGCVMNNKFAVCGFRCATDMQFSEITEVFRPEQNKWVEVNLRMEGLRDTAFSVGGNPAEGILSKYDGDLSTWKALATSDTSSATSLDCCQLALYGSNLFVLGDGLNVVHVRIDGEGGEASVRGGGAQRRGTPQACQVITL